MWTVVYMAKNKASAEALREALEQDGLLVKLTPVSGGAEQADGSCNVLVPESEVAQAHRIIIEMGF